jgi:magnesium transporter
MNKLAKIHPEDLADYLEMTHFHNARRFLKTLHDEKAAEVFASLQIQYQTKILEDIESERGAMLISLVDPDEAVDVLLTLTKERRSTILSLLKSEKQKELYTLLNLSDSPVGNLMTTEFLLIPCTLTMRDVLQKIKKDTEDFSSLHTIYISNNSGHLVGVLSLHELLLMKQDVPIYKYMIQHPIYIQLTTPMEIVVKKMFRYKLSTIPVIDNNKKMLGIVTTDDISDIILKKIV